MMWSSIENLKQNLNKIALDVHDDDEELKIHSSVNGYDSPVSDRRNSHSFAHSKSASRSPIPNGIDSPNNFEIEQYKAEIKRRQESEAESKALSVNYAALLKVREDQISRLNQEICSLKENLDVTKEALNVSRNENLSASSISIKGGDQPPKRQHKSATQARNRSGNQMQNGVFSKQDGIGNGITHDVQPDVTQSNMEITNLNSQMKEKELADLLEEKNRSLAALQATHELQAKQLRMDLENERKKLGNIQLKLQEEQNLNKSFQEELSSLKMDKQKTSMELSKIHSELNEKASEIRQLQMEMSRREDDNPNDSVKSLKRLIATLEKENDNLKKVDASRSFPRKEEMELSLQKLERDLKETRREKDKAVQELTRLKQHLLEKESEESEKMDEDSKIIEELRQHNEYQKAQILHLEKALKQAVASQEEVKMIKDKEIQKSKEIIEDLNKKLANCTSSIESKNDELQNLQTALGQYFAEVEAKEHLQRQLALAREESAKLSEILKEAGKGTEESKREKEEILAKLSDTERKLADGKNRVNKLEEDNAKLRRALEQSMTRLNRMSMDSDYLVDRRIVIKLLVTYFQRNHSKEVLDLMVRMLGFSDEEKQRIGVAQQGGKGVVRGVLGLPGRLVGGILGGSSADVHANMASDQSFADMWVDFLLKETEEREKRESGRDIDRPNEDSQGRSPSATGVGSPMSNHVTGTPSVSGFSQPNLSANQNRGPLPYRGNLPPFAHSDSESTASVSGVSGPNFSGTHSNGSLPYRGNLPPFANSDSEFSTVPLTSLDSTSRFSRLLTKH